MKYLGSERADPATHIRGRGADRQSLRPSKYGLKVSHRFLGLNDFVHDDLQWAILMCTSQPYANENYFFHEI